METASNDPTPSGAPKKSKKIYWILAGVAVFCCLACCVVPAAFMGLLGFGAHHLAIETEKKVQEEPAMEVSASAIISDYRANAASGNDKYKDKVIQVTGTVEKIEEAYVELESNNGFVGKEFDLLRVDIYFSDAEKTKMTALSNGETITVKGICTGKGFADSINVENCIMVK